MTLGEQIKQAREGKNISQEELAESIGVSRQAVSKWENNTSVPHGVNREMLSKVLELEELKEETVSKKSSPAVWGGWIVALIMLVIAAGIWISRNSGEDESGQGGISVEPVLKSIQFYNSEEEEVVDEGLWYNSAEMESILIQWTGGAPDSIQIFTVPTGSDMAEHTELLLTKPVLSTDPVALLSAESLKSIVQGQVYFVLDFGDTTVTSDMYNVFYDTGILEE